MQTDLQSMGVADVLAQAERADGMAAAACGQAVLRGGVTAQLADATILMSACCAVSQAVADTAAACIAYPVARGVCIACCLLWRRSRYDESGISCCGSCQAAEVVRNRGQLGWRQHVTGIVRCR